MKRCPCCGDLMHWIEEIVSWFCGTCFVSFESAPPFKVSEERRDAS